MTVSRPNILLLYTDQQRGDALGTVNDDVLTPHMDALARRGTHFTNHFVQNPLCMPSRVSMLSGRLPSSLGITSMGVPVPEDLPTLPVLLGRAGYTTANLGKLHFLPHANRDHRLPHPTYGFDRIEISDEPGVYDDAYLAWVHRQDPNAVDAVRCPLPPARAVWERLMGGDAEAVERADYAALDPLPAPAELSHSVFVAQRTIEFLAERSSADPFFCIAGFYNPHPPLRAPQRFLDLYDPDGLHVPDDPIADDHDDPFYHSAHRRLVTHGYYALVSEVDHHIGRILAELDRLGLTDDTIVVLTSDHGEWLGQGGRYGKGFPGDDLVTRVPLVIAGPGVRSSVVDEVIEAVDLAPTLLELAEVQPPPFLQGCSRSPELSGAPGDPTGVAVTEGAGWKSLRSAHHRYRIDGDGESLHRVRPVGATGTDREACVDDPALLAEHRALLLDHLLRAERPLQPTFPY